MKRIFIFIAILGISLTQVMGQSKSNIKNKGTITITKDGKTKEYVFDVDTTLLNNSISLNELLDQLDISVNTELDDSITADFSTDHPNIIIEEINDTVVISTIPHKRETTSVSIGNKNQIRIEENSDTVTIKIGGKTMRVVENDNGSVVTFDDDKDGDMDCDNWSWKDKKDRKKFNGHYGLMEFGINTFTEPDYSMYPEEAGSFMDLDHNRSTEFNLNIFWKSFGLQKHKGNIGMVTGLGFSWNNYFFAKDVTLDQGDSKIEPIFTEDVATYGYIQKTKLVASYLTIPLLLEFQAQTRNDPFYVQVGGIGGLKLGSHTKVKHAGNKDKDFSDFYLAPFRYGVTARMGYGSIYVYGNYFLSEMFRTDRGPEMNPFTVGIGFPAF